MVSLSSYKIRGRKHWEDVVPLRALRLPTHITTTGKRPYHGALRFSSIHIEIRKKKILLTTTSRSVPVANSTKCTDRKVHTARILFQPPFLSVFLDGASAPVLESVVDLSIVVDEHGGASVGFTASTSEVQQPRSRSQASGSMVLGRDVHCALLLWRISDSARP